ncbi:MAG: hypothetical protein JNK16_09105 [Phycisphaerales bacterium]|nr:hypothetical protein [Phycisphaerales bacterium]
MSGHGIRSSVAAALLLLVPCARGGDPTTGTATPGAAPSSPFRPNTNVPQADEGTGGRRDATIPGLSPETFTVAPGRYFPEGTFLVRRTGTVRILRTGEAVFIPDMPSPRDARRRGERPMLLLPSQTLAALQSSIASSANPEETRVEVSGQLFVYRERQQLLPTIFTVVRSATPAAVDAAAKPSAPPAPPAVNEAGEATSVRPGDDPEVADIIRQLESRRSEALPPISGATAETGKNEEGRTITAADADRTNASRSLVPEGTIFTDRRGRLVRMGDRLGIAFDGDANTPAEPAMYIIRSKALERLENSISSRTGSVDIVLTGRVYTYRNQNYILPLMAQLEPQGQLKPLQ